MVAREYCDCVVVVVVDNTGRYIILCMWLFVVFFLLHLFKFNNKE